MAILPVFFAENLEFFALTPKFIKKTLLCSKELFFSQNDPQRSKKTVSLNSPKNLCKKSETDKMGHRTIEHQEMWWKITFWIFNMQFRERSQKFFGQRPSVCRSNNEKDERTFFWTTLFPSKCSSGLPEQKFGCLAAFLPKIQNFFLLWFRNFLKNTSLFERIFLLSKLSSALEESSFDKLSKKSLLKVGNWQNRSSDIKKCDEKHLPGLLLWKLENADKQSRQCLSV